MQVGPIHKDQVTKLGVLPRDFLPSIDTLRAILLQTAMHD